MSDATQSQLWANITVAATVLLIILVVYFGLSSGLSNPIILLILVIPLMLTIPGLLKHQPRSFQWLCFAILFYLTLGILLAFSPAYFFTGLAIALVCVLMFVSAIIFIRRR